MFYVFLLLTLINAFEAVACHERYFNRVLLRFQHLAAISGLRSKSSIRTRDRILDYMKIIRIRDWRHHAYHHHPLARVRQRQSKVLRVVQSHSFQYVKVLFLELFYVLYIFYFLTLLILSYIFILFILCIFYAVHMRCLFDGYSECIAKLSSHPCSIFRNLEKHLKINVVTQDVVLYVLVATYPIKNFLYKNIYI